MKIYKLWLGSKKEKYPQRQYSGHDKPQGHNIDHIPSGLGHYNGLVAFCDLCLLCVSYYNMHSMSSFRHILCINIRTTEEAV